MSLQDIAQKFSLKTLPESEIELAGDVPYEAVEAYRAHALLHIAEHMELPGFRPGKVPTDMALKKVGDLAVLEEAVELFVRDFYPVLVGEKKVGVVGRPEIKVTKLAPQNPIGLLVQTTIYPEVPLPKNWKELHEKVPVEPYTGELPKAEPMPSEEDQAKAREMLARNIRRGKLIDALLERAQLTVPRIFIESELEKIMGQMRDDIQRMGVQFDDYLKHVQKTEAQIRDDFRDQAKKRAALQLLLNKIAEEEKLVADPAAVEAEMKHALEHFPEARKDLLKIHIETVLKNEQALKVLEGEKQ